MLCLIGMTNGHPSERFGSTPIQLSLVVNAVGMDSDRSSTSVAGLSIEDLGEHDIRVCENSLEH